MTMPTTRTTSRKTTAATKRGNQPAVPESEVTAATDNVQGTADQLRQVKLALMGIREKLMLVSPDLLNDTDHEAWSTQIFEVSRAINAVRNAQLESLSEKFRSELPAFSAATMTLVDDLFALQKAAAVITAVGSVLNILTKIVKLA
jgi:hypothetical protein